MKDILQDDRRATEVIRRMRSLLKKAPFELKNLDLNDVVRETIDFLSSLAVGRKFALVSVITPEALPILGDRIQLQQVILNLVVNGIDAMKDTPSENRIISIRTSRVENFAELSVSDRGPGIPEDKLKEVFEPFFTSKAEGMGMGLSIARTIVEAHNGLISAKNRDHGGARFKITLPLSGQGRTGGSRARIPSAPLTPTQPPPEPMRRKSSRVTWCPCERGCAGPRGTSKPLQLAVDSAPGTTEVRRQLLQRPPACLLDQRLEPGEERRRVGIVQSRTSTDAHQPHLDQVDQPAAQRHIEVRQIAHRHERHRVQRRRDPLKPATVSIRAQGSQDQPPSP